ncbi:MAG: hypothetical protein ACTSP7_00465 [Candidatus Heimdallarchaeota archaeon]
MVEIGKVFLTSFIVTIIQNAISFLLLFYVTDKQATFWGLLVFSAVIIWLVTGFYLNNYKESLLTSGLFNILLFPMLIVLLYVFKSVSIKLVNIINLETILNSSTLDNLSEAVFASIIISLVVFAITAVLAVSSSLFRSRILEYHGTTSIDQYESAHFDQYETASTEGEYAKYDEDVSE